MPCTRAARTPPWILRGRNLILLATLAIPALACSLLNPFQRASPADTVDLSSAVEIYDEAGVSLQDALAVEAEDQRQQVLDLMGAPDAFTLEWQELEGQLVRWEEWSYFDFESRFDFVDGELLWTLDIAAAPDGSFYAHAFDPLAFQPDLSTADVKAMFPDLPFMEIPLGEADIPAGFLLATDQLLLGFSEDRLVYVQTFILSPDEPLLYDAGLAPATPAP
jgi:hypothetical protein